MVYDFAFGGRFDTDMFIVVFVHDLEFERTVRSEFYFGNGVGRFVVIIPAEENTGLVAKV